MTPLSPPPAAHPFPVTVRPMTSADADAVSALRVAAWRAAYAGLVPAAYLDAMDPARDAAHRRKWLATRGDRAEDLLAVPAPGSGRTGSGGLAGWAAVGPYRGEGADAARAELYALYVRPDLLGRGVGGVLVRAAEEWAAGRGHTRLALWVLAGNERARRFYARAGFAPDGGERVDAYDGAELTEVRYERSLTT